MAPKRTRELESEDIDATYSPHKAFPPSTRQKTTHSQRTLTRTQTRTISLSPLTSISSSDASARSTTGSSGPRRSHRRTRGESQVSTLSTATSLTSLTTLSSAEDNDASRKLAAEGWSKTVEVDGTVLKATEAFDTFWYFVSERQAIDDKRRSGEKAPWTADPVLQDHFFCNTFRVLDKGCQFLIKEVIEKGSQETEEVVFRVLLYNAFTKIETWQLLNEKLGPITWAKYNREQYIEVLASADFTLYTGAFIQPAPKNFGYSKNHANHLVLIEHLMEEKFPWRLFLAPSMASIFDYIHQFPSMGPFTANQLLLNLSYTHLVNFHPDDFTVSGPGSLSGLQRMFGKSWKAGGDKGQIFHQQAMRYLTETQEYHCRRLGLKAPTLGPDKLRMTIVDVEHALCELDKYIRAKQRKLGNHRKMKNSVLGPAVLPKAWSGPQSYKRKTPRISLDPGDSLKRYVVESFKDHRDVEMDGENVRQYFVSWVGYSAKDNTWEYESSLIEDCPDLLRGYIAERGIQLGSEYGRQ